MTLYLDTSSLVKLYVTESGSDIVHRLVTSATIRSTVYPQLIQHPHFGPHIRKLKHYAPETWRYRIGAWRFFYEIDDDERTVFMIAAAHRGSAY